MLNPSIIYDPSIDGKHANGLKVRLFNPKIKWLINVSYFIQSSLGLESSVQDTLSP